MKNPNLSNGDAPNPAATQWESLGDEVKFNDAAHAGTGEYKQEYADLQRHAAGYQGLAEAPNLTPEAEAARDAAAIIARRQKEYLNNVEAEHRAEAATLRAQGNESAKISEVPVNEELAVKAFFEHGMAAESQLRKAQVAAEKYAAPHSKEERHQLDVANSKINSLEQQVEDFNRRKTNRRDIVLEAQAKMQTYDAAKKLYDDLGPLQKLRLRVQGKTLPSRDEALSDYDFRADALYSTYAGMSKKQ